MIVGGIEVEIVSGADVMGGDEAREHLTRVAMKR